MSDISEKPAPPSPGGWPTVVCIDCARPVIVARYIDGWPLHMDSEPVTDGEAILAGEWGAEPIALFGIDDEEGAAFWHVDFQADRYDQHKCVVLAAAESPGSAR